jgi:rare lipoprotein A
VGLFLMMFEFGRGKSAHLALALVTAGLATSTAGRAVTPIQPQASLEVPALAPVQEELAPRVEEDTVEHIGDGEASYYGKELAGNRTASGERFNPAALTAAHRTLPLGSKIRVTNKGNGRSVVVRINDRGPFTKHRLIDVSYAAAQRIQMVQAGTARVRLELLS